MIDSSASAEKQTIMLAHELAHFFTDTLSDISTDDEVIKLNEMIADEFARKELGKNEK